MGRWLYLVYCNSADPTREAELNKWYDNVHLPDVLTTPGFRRAWRYENTAPAPGEGKFVAAYDIESDDIDATMAALRQNITRWHEQGHHSSLLKVTGRGLYRLLTPETKAK